MVAAGAAMGLVVVFENGWYNRKLINYAPWQQLWDNIPITAITILISVTSYFITAPIHNIWLKLITGSFAFGSLYLISTFITHTFPQEIEQLIRKVVFKRV